MTGRAFPFAILLFARTATNAILLIGPVILARTLSVEDFGLYREYMLYVTIFLVVSGISIYESLLYLVPTQAKNDTNSIWRINGFVAVSSVTCSGAIWIGSAIWDSEAVMPFASLLALYLLLAANLDHWEFLWLAQGKAKLASIYISLRAAGKTIVATVTAVISANVQHILVALIAFEGIRLIGAVWAFLRTRKPSWDAGLSLREQLAYCVPLYLSNVVVMASRLSSAVFVSLKFSSAYFAIYAVIMFFETIISIVRNTLCSILFPDIARRFSQGDRDALRLWKRYVSLTCLFVFPSVSVLWNGSAFILGAVFGDQYAAGGDLLKIFSIYLLRECFDLSALLKALGKSARVTQALGVGLMVNLALMYALHRDLGMNGVMAAFVSASCVEALILTFMVTKATGIPIRQLIPVRELGSLSAAALFSAVTSAWGTDAIDDATMRNVCAIGVNIAAYVAFISLFRSESFTYVRHTLLRLRIGAQSG